MCLYVTVQVDCILAMIKFWEMQIYCLKYRSPIHLFCFTTHVLGNTAWINKLIGWKWCAKSNSWSITLESCSRKKSYFNPVGFFFYDKDELDTMMWIMTDGEAILWCVTILFCEEVPAVNFMGMMVVRRQSLCIPFYLCVKLWYSSCWR